MTKPIHKHKEDGTFRKDRHEEKDFTIIDGLVKMTPKCPEDYSEEMKEVWNRYWRHLIKHGYGKECDKELMDFAVRAWNQYHHYRKFDQSQADRAEARYWKNLDMLGISPTSMAKVAILQKKQIKLSPSEIARQKAQGE